MHVASIWTYDWIGDQRGSDTLSDNIIATIPKSIQLTFDMCAVQNRSGLREALAGRALPEPLRGVSGCLHSEQPALLPGSAAELLKRNTRGEKRGLC